MAELDQLEDELRALGRTMVVAAPRDDLVEQVLARLPAAPRRRRTPWAWLMARRRRLVKLLPALDVVMLPVRNERSESAPSSFSVITALPFLLS